MKHILCFCFLPVLGIVTHAAEQPEKPKPNPVAEINLKLSPTEQMVYKKIGDRELHLDLFKPQDWKTGDKRPCYVGIHGGGWTSGAPRVMYAFADHCARFGMVGACPLYRLYKPGTDITVAECVKDVRSAMRYLRSHAEELGIDPRKIVVSGASAGGHLAVATALFDINEAGEDTSISCAPNALVLLSPVIDTSTEGYGNAKVVEQWKALSPAHQVRPGMPPTLMFHGTEDATTPFKGAQVFHDAMLAAGNRSELVKVEGEQHTYMFKDLARYHETLQRLDTFLISLGFIPSSRK